MALTDHRSELDRRSRAAGRAVSSKGASTLADLFRPFVYCFETEQHFYVYDVNTNRVFQTDPVVHAILKQCSSLYPETVLEEFGDRFCRGEIETALTEIEEAQGRGIFLSDHPQRMEFGLDLAAALARERCEQLILNLTEQCNLRCSYCVYSGRYQNRRIHSHRAMTEETALRAVDWFLTECSEDPYIGFYGGEPLLAFPLLRRVVEYVQSKTNLSVQYSLTSNGTLLDDESIRFFIDHDFNLTISLDGPKEIHDRYRKNREGHGTWASVIGNLRKIRAVSQSYYQNRVLFSVVHAPPQDMAKTACFFEHEELLKLNALSHSYLDHADNDFLPQVPSDWAEEAVAVAPDFSSVYLDKRIHQEVPSNFIKELYEKNLLRFYKRPQERLASLFPNGCCIPGRRRISVDIEGRFFVCEKLDGSYCIGNLTLGLQMHKVEALVNDYIAISSDCFDCWACRLCTHCFASYSNTRGLDPDIRETECRSTCRQWGETLRIFYTLWEHDPQALEAFASMELE